ncbi:endothelin-converting enzyme-like 1 [Rhipicephalus sanguineus]|uniref:endothelin-converting enzyme-like 1 n=1 Tax=Rhipicephalus sanguineus TaxID=34632 RepID=UPI001894605D|nr:endothelin-converting enzyme-like 1 [Rhipicephalus sanguineus]
MSLHEERRPIIVGCSMVIVAGFLVVVVVVLVLTSPEKKGPVACESAACVELDGLLKASINASVNPCVNFYKHVCGSSFANGHTSVYRQLVERFGRALISFTNDDVAVSAVGQTPVQKVALFLRTCLLTIAYDKQSEVAEFRRKLTEIGVVWPSFSQAPNVIGTAAKVYATFQVAPLLEIKRSRVGEEGGPYASVGPDTTISSWKEKRDGMRLSGTYEVFYADTVAMYTGQKSMPSSSEFKKFEDVESVVLEKLVRSRSGRPDYVHRLLTVNELELFTPKVKPGVWQTLVTGDLGLSTSAEVRVRDPEYLKRLDDIFGEVEERDLHFYLDWYVLQAMGRFMSASLSKLWYAESWATRDPTVSGEPSFSTPSVADCLQLTESLLGWSLFQHFATVKIDPAVLHKVNAMADTINTELAKRLEAAPWVTQKDFSHLVEAFAIKAASKDVLYHSSLFSAQGILATAMANVSDMHPSSFFINWVNAAATTARLSKSTWDQVSTSYIAAIRNNDHFVAFDSASQSVRLPPYFAMVPVFHPDLTDSANYGALGTILGTGSVHLLVSMLSRKESPLLAEAAKRLDCYAEQAASENVTLPRERLYLAASLPLVWEAYQNRRLLGVGDHRKLKDFSSEKSFFVTTCYSLCDGRDAPDAAEFACNAAVKNIKAFGVAYSCKKESPMHPRQRCQLFN